VREQSITTIFIIMDKRKVGSLPLISLFQTKAEGIVVHSSQPPKKISCSKKNQIQPQQPSPIIMVVVYIYMHQMKAK
jgi:hypothetical protein